MVPNLGFIFWRERDRATLPQNLPQSAAKPYFSAGAYQILMKISENVRLDGILSHAKNQHRFMSSFWS